MSAGLSGPDFCVGRSAPLLSTQRYLIAAAVGFLVLWLAIATFSAMGESGSKMEADSHGTAWHGYKAIYEISQRQNLTARRNTKRQSQANPDRDTQVLLSSDPLFAASNPLFTQNLFHWVEDGGRAIIADPIPGFKFGAQIHPERLYMAAGFPKIRMETLERDEWKANRRGPVPLLPENDATLGSVLGLPKSEAELDLDVATARIQGDGRLQALAQQHPTIVLPRSELQVLDLNTTLPLAGVLRLADRPDAVLAAVVRVGRGEVLLVSDPRLFSNGILQYSGGASVALGLIQSVHRGGVLEFDHFFRGGGIRGNPTWLLVQMPYGWICFWVVVASVSAVWCLASYLGPPDPDPIVPPPGLSDHLKLISGILDRPSNYSDNLQTLRNAVLWHLHAEFGISRSPGSLDRLIQAMERRYPERSKRLTETLQRLRNLTAQELNAKTIVTLSQELVRCLSRK